MRWLAGEQQDGATAVEDDVEACVITATEKQPEEQERIQKRRQSPRKSGTTAAAEEEARKRLLRLRRRLRPLHRGDLPAVRAAHAELFPIDYEEAFYEAVAEGTGGVFALGLFDDEDEEEEEDGKSRGPAAPSSLPALFAPPPPPASSSSSLVAFVTARLQNASHVDRTDAAYLGLLEEAEAEARADAATAAAAAGAAETAAGAEAATTTTTITSTTTPPPPQQTLGPGVDLLGPSPSRPAAAYILTLGVSKKRRGEGIGKMLVSAVAERAAAAICCPRPSPPPPAPPPAEAAAAAALVYLHVAAFNPVAVSLYLSCGFSRLATLRDFYSISTERRPDPARTRYDAHLFAMRIEAVSSSSSSKGGGEEALWPWPLPPPPPLPLPLSLALASPSPSPSPLVFPPAVAALAGALSWLSSLASSLLARVAFGPAKKGEEGEKEAETLPRTTAGAKREAPPPPAPWLSRLFRRTG